MGLLNNSNIPRRVIFFLEEQLDAKILTLEDYVKKYVRKAFAEDGATIQKRRRLLDLLERRIGVLEDNNQIRDILSTVCIVECEDGVFRRPINTYFKNDEVESVLGSAVAYAQVPDMSKGRQNLYEWLRVRQTPSLVDILDLIGRTVETKPTGEARTTVTKMLDVVGRRWSDPDETDRRHCELLKRKAWLPVEADEVRWYKPHEVSATYSKQSFLLERKIPGCFGWESTSDPRLLGMARSQPRASNLPGCQASALVCRKRLSTAIWGLRKVEQRPTSSTPGIERASLHLGDRHLPSSARIVLG